MEEKNIRLRETMEDYSGRKGRKAEKEKLNIKKRKESGR